LAAISAGICDVLHASVWLEQAQENSIRLLPIAAVVAAFEFTPVAFAQIPAPTPTPTNKVDCEKAKVKWDEKGGKDGKRHLRRCARVRRGEEVNIPQTAL
jgi:hypothetical protein